jgi:hypothetical protein
MIYRKSGHYIWSYYLSLIACILLISSCYSDNSEVAEGESNEITTQQPQLLSNVNFYLEVSKSMEGYISGGSSEFNKVVSSITSTVVNSDKKLAIYTISNRPEKYGDDYNSFNNALVENKIKFGESSRLSEIFDTVIKKNDKNTISFIVTDAIMSVSNAQIRKNPEINRELVETTLRYEMLGVATRLKKQGWGLTVYQMNSTFTGTYYTYSNHKQPYKNENRPYYVWVLGPQDLLTNYVNEVVDQRTGLKGAKNKITFGSLYTIAIPYRLFFKAGKKGEWQATSDGKVEDIEVSEKEPVTFLIGVNLDEVKGLPVASKNEQYLKDNLLFGKDGANNYEVSIEDVFTSFDFKTEEKEEDWAINYSHFILIGVRKLYTESTELNIILPYKLPQWYLPLHVENDIKPFQNKGTFGLKYLIEGIDEGFSDTESNYFQITIPLTKD